MDMKDVAYFISGTLAAFPDLAAQLDPTNESLRATINHWLVEYAFPPETPWPLMFRDGGFVDIWGRLYDYDIGNLVMDEGGGAYELELIITSSGRDLASKNDDVCIKIAMVYDGQETQVAMFDPVYCRE